MLGRLREGFGRLSTTKKALVATGTAGALAASALAVDVATNPLPRGLESRLFALSGAPDVPEDSDFKIDIDKVRKMLEADPTDDLPTEVRWLPVVQGQWSESFVTGEGSAREAVDYIFAPLQLVYADGRTIVIDPTCGPDSPHFQNTWLWADSSEFVEGSFEELEAAMLAAYKILVGHGHWDHTEGLVLSRHAEELIAKTIFTREQVEHLGTTYGGWDEASVGLIPDDNVLPDEPYKKIAPGVVMIHAPGHTPGHYMLFIELGNGEEFLVVGDTVHNMKNVEEGVARSRLLSKASEEDAEAVLAQVSELIRLNTGVAFDGSEDVHLMVTHDPKCMEALTSEGVIQKGFATGDDRPAEDDLVKTRIKLADGNVIEGPVPRKVIEKRELNGKISDSLYFRLDLQHGLIQTQLHRKGMITHFRIPTETGALIVMVEEGDEGYRMSSRFINEEYKQADCPNDKFVAENASVSVPIVNQSADARAIAEVIVNFYNHCLE